MVFSTRLLQGLSQGHHPRDAWVDAQEGPSGEEAQPRGRHPQEAGRRFDACLSCTEKGNALDTTSHSQVIP